MLDSRGSAVGTRDRNAFLASVDPSSAEFFSAQQSWFDQIGSVPIEGYSLELDVDEAPEFTRERDRERRGPSVVVALVEERFRIKGFDEHPAVNSLFYTFVELQDRWVITSDSDLEDIGLFTSRQPWDFGPLSVSTSEHFMIVTHPGDSERASLLLSIAEAALPAVDRAWKSPWTERVVMFVPGDRAELERLLDATFDVANFVAVASSTVDLDLGWHPITRIVVNPDNFLRRSRAAQTTILIHELVHVATRPSSGPFVSSLVEEGLAQLAEFPEPPTPRELARSLNRQEFDGILPDDADFFTGGGPSIRRSYLEALSASAYMVERFGIDGLNRFYSALGSARIEPGTAQHHLGRALETNLGITFADFEYQWAEAVRKG